MKKLNDAQRELLTNNYNLVYTFCNSKGLCLDEWQDILLLALCEKVPSYDDSKCKFSTFAYMVMECARKNEIISRGRDNKVAHYNGSTISTDTVVAQGDKKELTLGEIIPDDSVMDIDTQVAVNMALEYLVAKGDKDAEIFLDVIKDEMSQKEIAEKYNTTQATISRTVKRVQADLYKRFREVA